MGHVCFWISWKPMRCQGVSVRMEEAAEDRGRMGREAGTWLWLEVDGTARTAIRQLGCLPCKAGAGNRAGTKSGSWAGIRNRNGLRKHHWAHESHKQLQGRGMLDHGSIHQWVVANIQGARGLPGTCCGLVANGSSLACLLLSKDCQ